MPLGSFDFMLADIYSWNPVKELLKQKRLINILGPTSVDTRIFITTRRSLSKLSQSIYLRYYTFLLYRALSREKTPSNA